MHPNLDKPEPISFGSCVTSVRTCHCEPLGEAVSSYVKVEIASDCVLAMTCTHLIDEPKFFDRTYGRIYTIKFFKNLVNLAIGLV